MDSRGIPISMGGRAFIVTQSIKKLSDTLKNSVFNDYDYRLLSDNLPVTIRDMKSFDRYQKENRSLYNDFAYKVIIADKVDLGLYEEKTLANGKIKRVKAMVEYILDEAKIAEEEKYECSKYS